MGIIADTANKAFDVTERNLVSTNLIKRSSEDLIWDYYIWRMPGIIVSIQLKILQLYEKLEYIIFCSKVLNELFLEINIRPQDMESVYLSGHYNHLVIKKNQDIKL